jgi:hypothetical protein
VCTWQGLAELIFVEGNQQYMQQQQNEVIPVILGRQSCGYNIFPAG